MDTVAQAQFVHNYSKLLVDVWTNKQDFAQLEKDPASILSKYGITIKPSAHVQLEENGKVDASNATTGLAQQVAAWDQGHLTGKYILYIPKVPQIGIEPTTNALADTTYCCCCSPCCTCT